MENKRTIPECDLPKPCSTGITASIFEGIKKLKLKVGHSLPQCRRFESLKV